MKHRWPWWFLALWGLAAAGNLAAWFLVPWWSRIAIGAVSFGVLETIGLRSKGTYPPLTQAIRRYVPRWAAFPLLYFLVGYVFATVAHAPHKLELGVLVGLLGWISAHFDVTYDKP